MFALLFVYCFVGFVLFLLFLIFLLFIYYYSTSILFALLRLFLLFLIIYLFIYTTATTISLLRFVACVFCFVCSASVGLFTACCCFVCLATPRLFDLLLLICFRFTVCVLLRFFCLALATSFVNLVL